MSSINADNGVTSGITGIRTTADNTGNLALQSNGVTVLTLATNNTVTIAGTLATASQGITSASLPAGSVLQVVQTTSSTQVNTTSATPVATGFTASITPKFSTSKILITFSTTVLGQSGAECSTFIYRSTTAITGGIKSGGVSGAADAWTPLSITYLDSPATTSSTTYNIYFQRNVASGTVYMGATGVTSLFTLMEIAA